MQRAIALLAAVCWLLSAAQVAEALSHSTHGSEFVLLGLLSIAGLAGCAAWLASWRYAQAAVAGTAALYLVLYCVRTWTVQIEPRMAFTDASLLEATLDSLRIVQATVGAFAIGRQPDARRRRAVLRVADGVEPDRGAGVGYCREP